ncbi:MAG: 30S ribosomal protein S3ae [Nitrospiraceae bacterium]|nr:30S ribosomal protein S3ae [Nitrospiraceae bacterium]
MPRERIKRKRKEKEWYSVLAPHMFGKAKIAETLADDPEKLIGRNVEISFQELTNDFAKSQIKLKFKIVNTSGLEANTVFVGHSLTSDYIKRMSRKHKSKVDGVFDARTKDGIRVRVKPSALAGKRIQASQKRAIRAILKETIEKEAKSRNFEAFIKLMLDGELGKEAYRLSKKIYPIKRVEIYKSEILEIPKVEAIVFEEEEVEPAESAEEQPEVKEEVAEQPEEEETGEESQPEQTEEGAVQEQEEQPEETTEEQEQPSNEEESPEEEGEEKAAGGTDEEPDADETSEEAEVADEEMTEEGDAGEAAEEKENQ